MRRAELNEGAGTGFWDDPSGESQEEEMVKEARAEDMMESRKH